MYWLPGRFFGKEHLAPSTLFYQFMRACLLGGIRAGFARENVLRPDLVTRRLARDVSFHLCTRRPAVLLSILHIPAFISSTFLIFPSVSLSPSRLLMPDFFLALSDDARNEMCSLGSQEEENNDGQGRGKG